MTLKSMAIFFVDNQQLWPAGAKLHGNLVLWEDTGKYPTYSPIAVANHPEYDGKIVVQAGNRGLVVSLLQGAETPKDIQAAMSAKPGPEQYRIGVDAIVHAIMLMRADTTGGGDCHPFSLLTMLAKSGVAEATIILQALTAWIRDPKPGGANPQATADMVDSAEEMIRTLQAHLSTAPTTSP